MKRCLAHSLSLLVTVAFLCNGAAVAAEVSPLLLRYVADPEQTNAYSFQIESQGESGREAIAGTLLVSSRAVASNLIALTVRGQLRPKHLPGVPPIMPYRPGGFMSLSSYAQGFPQERELVIDERGKLVRQAGDVALPVPLGQLASSLILTFPAEPTTGWETEDEVFVLDEPLLQGPAAAFLSPPGGMGYIPYYPGRAPQGVLASRRKTKVKIADATDSIVTLQKTFSLDSYMLTGS